MRPPLSLIPVFPVHRPDESRPAMSLTFFRESRAVPLAQVDLIRFLLKSNGGKRSKIFPAS
jgi:hypothetical protein